MTASPPSGAARRRRGIAGSLLLAMTLTSIAHALFAHEVARTIPAALAWSAGLLLLRDVAPGHRAQVLAMIAIGVAGLVYAGDAGPGLGYMDAFVANEAILAMLGGVTFLRLVGRPALADDETLPVGRGALLRTLLGVHLFGSVINASALIIIGDRLTRRVAMTPLQAMVLTRAFACASFWSPFFAGMGVALTYAPGASLAQIALTGLPIAVFALLYCAFDLTRTAAAADFAGYPLHAQALLLPALLAVCVLALHGTLPAVSITTLVAGLSMLVSIIVLPLREGRRAPATLTTHVTETLPAMATELALFLAAGVLGTGIGAALAAAGVGLPFTHFGLAEALLLVTTMIGLAAIGVHPVISITLGAKLLAALAPDPDLLAICFVLSWGLGVAVSPFSGMNLMIQGHFGIDAHRFVRWNGRYTIVLLGAVAVALALRGLITSTPA